MTRIVSTNTKILQIFALEDTDALSEWENSFVANIMAQTRDATDCSKLSDKQRDSIDRIWEKHYA